MIPCAQPSGRYESTRVPTDLPALLNRVAARPSYMQSPARPTGGDACASSCGDSEASLSSSSADAQGEGGGGAPRAVFKSCPHQLCVDAKILLLCLEECFSNVAKYR